MEKELSHNIKPFLKYLGLNDDIEYEEKFEEKGLNKYTQLKLSNSDEYTMYKNNNNSAYDGDFGETRSYVELIIPKEKLKVDYSLYREDVQYYIVYIKAYIKKVYKCEIYAYTTDFKEWFTNSGLIKL